MNLCTDFTDVIGLLFMFLQMWKKHLMANLLILMHGWRKLCCFLVRHQTYHTLTTCTNYLKLFLYHEENEQLNDSLKPPVTVSSISQSTIFLYFFFELLVVGDDVVLCQILCRFQIETLNFPAEVHPKVPKSSPSMILPVATLKQRCTMIIFSILISSSSHCFSSQRILLCSESRVTSPFKPIATPSILNDSTHIEPESSNLPSKRLDFNSFDMDLDQLTEYNTEINRRSSIADFDHATDEENSCDHDSKLKFRKRKPTEKNNDAGNDTPSKKFKIEQEHNVQNDLSLSNDTTNHNNHRNNTNTSNSNTRASPLSTLLEGELSVDIGESNPLILTEEKENEPENVPSKKAKTKKRSKNSFLDRVFKTSLTTNAPVIFCHSNDHSIPLSSTTTQTFWHWIEWVASKSKKTNSYSGILA